jgi:hypothetical protein
MPDDALQRGGLQVAKFVAKAVNAAVFPFLDVRETNLLAKQAEFDPEARAKLGASRTETKIAVAMAMVPVIGRLGGVAKAAVPLAEEVASVVGRLMVKGGEAFDRQLLLKSVKAVGDTTHVKLATLGPDKIAEATKEVAGMWVKKVAGKDGDVVAKALESSGVKLSPDQLVAFKKQVVEQYAVNKAEAKATAKAGSLISGGELEDVVNQVAASRWGKIGDTAGFYARDFTVAMTKARGLRPEQALQLREVLKALFDTSHTAASALGGVKRTEEFKILAEHAAKALFG